MDDTSRRIARAEEEAPRAEGPAGDMTGHAGDRPRGEAAAGEPPYRVEVIRAEIEQTRDDLSETIDAIQERLRPRNIVAGATGRVKSAARERIKDMAHTAGDTAEDLMEQTRERAGEVTRSVRDNPLPAVLIGIGTAWMLMRRSESRGTPRSGSRHQWNLDRGSAGDYRLSSREAYDYGAYGDYDEEAEGEGPAARLIDHVKEHPIPAALAGVGLAWLAFANGDDRSGYEYEGVPRRGRRYGGRTDDPLRHEMGEAYGAATGASDAASGMTGGTHELASRAQDYAGETAREIRRRGRRAQSQFGRLLRENPLMVGAAAVVLGAAVGMALPETDREREWMGDTRDTFVDRAQEMARNAASRVQDAAGEVAGEVASRAVTGKDA